MAAGLHGGQFVRAGARERDGRTLGGNGVGVFIGEQRRQARGGGDGDAAQAFDPVEILGNALGAIG